MRLGPISPMERNLKRPSRVPYAPSRASIALGWLNYALALVVILLSLWLGLWGVFIEVLCLGALGAAALKALRSHLAFTDRWLLEYICSYLVVVVGGLVLLYDHASNFGNWYTHRADDQFFFYNIVQLASGELPATFSAYELCLAVFAKALFTLGLPTEITTILPINWMIGGIVSSLSLSFASNILKTNAGRGVALLALSGSVLLVENSASLFRDGFVAMLFMVVVCSLWRRRYALCTGATLILFGTRGGAAMSALLVGVMLLLAGRSSSVRGIYGLFSFAVVCGVGITFVPGFFKLLTPWDRGQDETRSEYFSARYTHVTSNEDNRGSLTLRLLSGGPIGKLLLPVTTVFAPFRLPSLKGEYVWVRNEGPDVQRQIFRKFRFAYAINVFAWVICAPAIIMGCVRCLSGRPIEVAVALGFIATVLAVTYVSLQERHRTIFIILFPVLIMHCYRTSMAPDRRRPLRWLTAAVALAIIGANINALSLRE